jgi:hypothetical protein
VKRCVPSRVVGACKAEAVQPAEPVARALMCCATDVAGLLASVR